MDSKDLIDLVRDAIGEDPRQRELAADRMTDWVSSYAPADAATLATILSACASIEKDPKVLESQLHALVELGSTGVVERETIYHLEKIDRNLLSGELREYVEDLLE